MDKGSVVLPKELETFARQRGHEASVMWGFAEIRVEVARFFPARVGLKPGQVICQVTSLLAEWDYVVTKRVSV